MNVRALARVLDRLDDDWYVVAQEPTGHLGVFSRGGEYLGVINKYRTEFETKDERSHAEGEGTERVLRIARGVASPVEVRRTSLRAEDEIDAKSE